MKIKNCFQVIADPTIEAEEQVEQILTKQRSLAELPDDALFMNVFIPQKVRL